MIHAIRTGPASGARHLMAARRATTRASPTAPASRRHSRKSTGAFTKPAWPTRRGVDQASETRHLRVPRLFDQTGIPFHEDGQAVIKERIYADKANPNIIHDEISTIDNALTRPWSVKKTYRREPKVVWPENNCTEGN